MAGATMPEGGSTAQIAGQRVGVEVLARIAPPAGQRGLVGHIVRALGLAIVGGQIPPGGTLPSEADLCQQFGVSRTVVREATRIFQQNYEQDVVFTRAGGLAACLAEFHRLHEDFYGYCFPDQPVELVHLRLSVIEAERGDGGTLHIRAAAQAAGEGARARGGWDMGGRAVSFAVHRRSALPPSTVLAGPAIVEEVDSTTFVPSGTQLEVHQSGNLIITEAA